MQSRKREESKKKKNLLTLVLERAPRFAVHADPLLAVGVEDIHPRSPIYLVHIHVLLGAVATSFLSAVPPRDYENNF